MNNDKGYEALDIVETEKALKEALQELEDLMDKHKEQRETVEEELSSTADSTKALGGNAGRMGQHAYDDLVCSSYDDMKARLHSYMNVGIKKIVMETLGMLEESMDVLAERKPESTSDFYSKKN